MSTQTLPASAASLGAALAADFIRQLVNPHQRCRYSIAPFTRICCYTAGSRKALEGGGLGKITDKLSQKRGTCSCRKGYSIDVEEHWMDSPLMGLSWNYQGGTSQAK